MSIGVAPTSAPFDEDARNPMLWKVAKFGVVGGVATVVHLSIAWILLGPLGGLVANAAGFVAGLGVTYLGNYFATFKSQAAHAPTLTRFLVVSAATLAASEWAFVALHAMRVDERIGLVVAIILLPLLRFGLLARQVFVPSDTQTSLTEWLITVGVWGGSIGFGLLALWAATPDGFLDPSSPIWAHEMGVDKSAPTETWYDLVENWRSPLPLAASLDDPDGVGVTGVNIPLFDLAARAGRRLLGDDLNYVPAWFLLAFSAVGPSAVALLHSFSVRRPDMLLVGAAAAAALPALAFHQLHPALSGVFLPLVVMAAVVRIGRTQPRWSAPMLLCLALVVAAMTHPFLLLASLLLGGASFAMGYGWDSLP